MTVVRRDVVAAVAVALLLAVLGVVVHGARMDVGPAVATGEVVLDLNDFRPGHVEVAVGDTVTWQWQGVAHDLVFEDGTTVAARADGTWQRTFDSAGTWDYRCTIHGPMRGRVTVS